MFSINSMDQTGLPQWMGAGRLLLQRGVNASWVSYLELGRVALGVRQGSGLEHQIGLIEGPCWLDASSAVLNLPSLVDAVADTTVRLRLVSVDDFRQGIAGLPAAAQQVLTDVAMAHRKQTEYAVSRLAKDAHARCAEWLLCHAQSSDQGLLAVQLQQRKCSIAVQLGITPETFSRVLRHLREQRLISGTGRVLNLLNPKALRSLARV